MLVSWHPGRGENELFWIQGGPEEYTLPSLLFSQKGSLQNCGGGLSEEGQTIPKGEELLAAGELSPAIINSLLLDLSWRPPMHQGVRHDSSRLEKPCHISRQKGGTSEQVAPWQPPPSLPPLEERICDFFAARVQAASHAGFQGWWQILEKGQKWGKKTVTYANQVWGWLKEGLAPVCVPVTSTELDADTWKRRKKMPEKASLMLSCSGGFCVHQEGKEAFPLEPLLAKMVHMSKCLWGRGD